MVHLEEAVFVRLFLNVLATPRVDVPTTSREFVVFWANLNIFMSVLLSMKSGNPKAPKEDRRETGWFSREKRRHLA